MGLTVIDAGVIIGVLDASDPHHRTAVGLLSAAVDRGDQLVVPGSVYAEVLVGPARRGPSGQRAVDEFIADLAADVEPITRQTAARAAQLRAKHGSRLKLPDALAVASAIHLKADRVLTTERRWPRLSIPIEVAD